MLGRLDRLSSNRIQTLLWGLSARPSLLLSISNCCVLLVLESKFFDVFNILHGKIFRSLNFHILEFYVKYAKSCTIRKFPAIQYPIRASPHMAHHHSNRFYFPVVHLRCRLKSQVRESYASMTYEDEAFQLSHYSTSEVQLRAFKVT